MKIRSSIISLCLVFLLLLSLSFGAGLAVSQYKLWPYSLIRDVVLKTRSLLKPTRKKQDDGSVKPTWLTETDNKKNPLKGLGYASGTETSHSKTGVVTNEPESYPGVNLYVSGHKPSAHLIDMNGQLLHRWEMSTSNTRKLFGKNSKSHWRRVHPLPDGSILAVLARKALIKLDKNSNIIWKKKINAHHDLDTDRSGRIYTLTTKSESEPLLGQHEGYLADYVSILDRNGRILKEINILDAFLRSEFSGYVDIISQNRVYYFHTNTVRLIDEETASHMDNPNIRAGHLLISMRYANTVAVLDPEDRKVTWFMAGLTSRQHEPVLTERGGLLIFDNHWQKDKRSRIVEFDPKTQETIWSYTGNELPSFFSKCCGTNQRLPNGNTLIAETQNARAIEVTPEKEVVWAFHNPHTLNDGSNKRGVIFSIKRYAKTYFSDTDVTKPAD